MTPAEWIAAQLQNAPPIDELTLRRIARILASNRDDEVDS